jgi:hypothetical protein
VEQRKADFPYCTLNVPYGALGGSVSAEASVLFTETQRQRVTDFRNLVLTVSFSCKTLTTTSVPVAGVQFASETGGIVRKRRGVLT